MGCFEGSPADAEIVNQCLVGDQSAWSLLYRRHHAGLVDWIEGRLAASGYGAERGDEIAGRVWGSLCQADGQRLRDYNPARATLAAYLRGLAKAEIRLFHRQQCRGPATCEVTLLAEELVDRRLAAPSVQALLEDFLPTCTQRERWFVHLHLREWAGDGTEGELSPSNYRKLKQRVSEKLDSFFQRN